MMDESSENISNPFSSDIEYTSIPEHALNIFRSKWKRFFLTALAVFGVIWTFVESGSYFLEIDLSGPYFYVSLGLISLTSAIIHSTMSYLKTPPTGLEELPYDIQRIAILKKPFWEYCFAYALLESKLSEIDLHLKGVLGGHVFIEITKRPKITDYIEWVQLRPTNLLNMIEIATRLLVYELPASLLKNKEQEISFQNIIMCVGRIKDLYQKACEYEIEGREIEPPEVFKKIHEIQSGWSKEIRNGVKQMLGFLDKLSKSSKKDLKNPIKFTIVFDEPEGIKEFEIEFQKIEGILPELILNEMLPEI